MTIPVVCLIPLGPKGPKIAKIAIFAILMRASRSESRARSPFAICIHVPSLKFQLNVGPDLCSNVRGGGGGGEGGCQPFALQKFSFLVSLRQNPYRDSTSATLTLYLSNIRISLWFSVISVIRHLVYFRPPPFEGGGLK